ncbi:phage tail-like protein [Actinoplanes lutulentus]|uniref:Phage tail-like protein n=1 Tax=Actinoplanes lutulentus TaxID=1287878 RepID=A0A327ZG24_9ACTN|nr:phage tail protein [Actinoplanes lutulentus]MBB2948494.1 phage tail-like protein [Actinoplanes lutulentus]RAK34474.1 phage tail-like protein [Actinoplanes lutulentus]
MVRLDPYRGFRFVVEVDGTTAGGFQSVTGIERQTRIEPYREGGVNDFEHPIAGVTTYPPLVLRRGLVDTTLWDWHQQVIGGFVARRTVSVILLDDVRAEAWRWICADAYPARWTGAELDALADAVATESVELVHAGLTRQ